MQRLTFCVLAACASQPRIPAVRFANAPAVTIVNDRVDVPRQPEERDFLEMVYHYDGTVQRRLTRAMELPRPRRALGVNALDEVPDSTWFTNRIGVRDYTPDELRAGPAREESPEFHKPWTVKSSKIGGTELGFIIVDARGEKFLLKFDPPEFPEQETATHVIVGKILWACGYETTQDYIVEFHPDDLVLAPGAYVKENSGHTYRLDRAELQRRLAKINRDADGKFRGLASRWLSGKPLGGHPGEGVREDDPNDRIAHQLRRDLRGLYAIAAWLDHEDIQESNFLDMWTEDSVDHKRHYVQHYMIDFGKSLGVMATTANDPRRGFEYVIDFPDLSRSLVTAGALERTWERRARPTLRGVGLYDADSFDPGAWKPATPAYVPFLTADRVDKFWAAKIIMRFTREQLHAIVESARLSDPQAVEYLTDTLVARQRATGEYWFKRTNPLDRFTIERDALCFDDLLLHYDLGSSAAETQYTVATFDRDARPVAERALIVARPDGHACTGALRLARGRDAYTIVELETIRPGFAGRTLVHVARDGAGALRVIGIWRP